MRQHPGREALIANGLNSRLRPVLWVLSWHEHAYDIWNTRIYAHEALGSKPNHPPGAWPVRRGIRRVRPLADATSIGGATFLAASHAVLGHPPRV
jgi:hypothetical protein